MKISQVNKVNDRTVQFTIEGTTIPQVNALRRYMVNYVPTLAIEEVEFKKNSSVLYDEMVAHRLGLLPLKTDLKSYTLKSECTCNGEGCAKCELKLTLKSKGTKIAKAKDIKSSDPEVLPIYEETPIVKLLDDQEIECTCVATLGVGKEHAKWSPCLAFYKHAGLDEKNEKSPIKDDAFVMIIESWGQLKPKEIAVTAIDVMNDHLADIKKQLH